MKSNKFYALVGFLGLVVTTLTVSTLASAYQGNPNVQGPNYDTARHELMLEAIENQDYNAWSELHQGKGRLTEVINQDNFDQFVEMHDLMMSGDKEGADEIRQVLGLGQGRMGKGEFSQGQGRGYRHMHEGCPYNQD